MGVKKYVAASMQKALKQIREELGDDAVILSSRKLGNGKVEISVSVEEKAAAVEKNEMESARSEHGGHRYSGQKLEPLRLSNDKARELLASVRLKQQHDGGSVPSELNAVSDSLNFDYSSMLQTNLMQLQQDVFELKNQLREQEAQSKAKSQPLPVTPSSNAQPRRTDTMAENLALVRRKWRYLGLDDGLFGQFSKSRGVHLHAEKTAQALWQDSIKYIKQMLPRYRLNPVESSGIYAFVGPTGAGKTTSLAKLAVRQVERWGADKVGILTMDSFRIGAWEQMQRLGEIIGIRTALCRQHDSLIDALAQMRHCRFILIDTAGLSHQDERRLTQWQKLHELGDELETFLVAPANLQRSVLDQLLKAYEPAAPSGMIYTKCDETTNLGEAVSALMTSEMPWVYACDGQKIPDDMIGMSIELVWQALVRTAKAGRWQIQGQSSEQEDHLAKAIG